MNTVRVTIPRAASRRIALELDHVVLEVADDERDPASRRRSSRRASGGVRAAPRSAGGQRPPAAIEAGPARSSIRSYSSRGGSDRSRSTSPMPHRVGRDPPERHGLRARRPGPARSRRASTAPSRRGGRGPRPAPSGPRPSRRRPRPAATARRPPPPVGWPPARPAPPGVVSSSRRPCAPVWHAGVAWTAKTTGRARRSAATGRPADSRGDPR